MNAENAAIQSDQRRTDKGKSVHITSNQDIKQQVPSGNFDLVAKSPQKSFFSSFHKRETMPPKIPVTTLRAITTEDSFVKLDYKIVRKPIKRKVSFKDKSWYDGEWDGTKKHGRGLLYYANGDMYEGEFSKGFRHGYATCKYQNGTTFNGYWVQDRACTKRQAIVIYESGDKYVGCVCSEEPSLIESLDATVNSGLPKIFRNGQGECHFVNGNKYHGNWKSDNMHGFGVMVYSNNQIYYGDWVEGKKCGHGMLLYTDGTVFEGEWKNDEKYGKGIMKLCNGDMISGTWKDDEVKKAKFIKGRIVDTPICSRLLLSEAVKSISESRFTFSMSKQTDWSGDKWRGFFYSRSAQIENERRENSKKYAAMSKDPEKIREEAENYINNNQLIAEMEKVFVDIFAWRYYSSEEASKVNLPTAVDDVLTFLSKYFTENEYSLVEDRLHLTVLHMLAEFAEAYGKKKLLFELKGRILKAIYKPLFTMYKHVYKEEDSMLKYKILSLNAASMQELGVKQFLIPDPEKLPSGYKDAIDVLKTMPSYCTTEEKFTVLVKVSDEILKVVQKQSELLNSPIDAGADDMLPVFLYVFIQAGLPNVYSEFKFLNDFVDERVTLSQQSYRFNNFELAIKFVSVLDLNVKDEKSVLVPFSVFEQRLERVVSDMLADAQKLQKRGPKLLWLSKVFMELGNVLPQKGVPYKPKCEQFNDMVRDFYTSATRVLKTAGLKVEEDKETKNTDGKKEYVVVCETVYPSFVYFKMANALEKIMNSV